MATMRIDPKQEHSWLLARLRDLKLDAERYKATASRQEWLQVSDQLGQVVHDIGLAEELLGLVEP